jgi:ferredoxin
MAKPHRGKGIRELFAHGRGECPVCKRNNVKVLYEIEAGEQKFKICKTCRAAIKNGKKSLPAAPKAAEPKAAEEATVKTETAEVKSETTEVSTEE